MPVKMSPVPPVAIPGLPVGLTHAVPSGSATMVRLPLSTRMRWRRRAKSRDPKPVGLHRLNGDARQARHFAGMRSEHQRTFAAVELVGMPVEGIESVGIDDQRNVGLSRCLMHELRRLRVASNARSDGDDRHRLSQLGEVCECGQRDTAGIGFRQRLGHQFGGECGNVGESAASSGHGALTHNPAQRGHSRHGGGA